MTLVDQSSTNPTGLPGLGDAAGALPPPPTGITTTPGGSSVSLPNIDANIQKINQVASSWGLPGLPDEVTLDLAANHPNPDQFLWGLASDIGRAGAPQQAVGVASQLALPNQPAPDSTGNPFRDQARSLFASMADLAQPTVFDPGSVEAIKSQAVKQGLLPASTPINGTWDPSNNEIAYQIQQNNFNQRVSGSRPGATTVDHVLQVANDLFNPSVLGRMAMSMGLLPDPHKAASLVHDFGHIFGAIGHIVSHPTQGGAWLNFFHQVANSRSDFFSTVLPLVNDALLLTGVGEAIGAARAVYGAEQVFKGLYAARALATAERLGQASKLAQLVKGVPGVGDATAGLMEQWRGLRAVKLAKIGVGQVGKRGLIGTAEQAVAGPNANLSYGSPANTLFGAGIHNQATVDQFKHQHLSNPYLNGFEQFTGTVLMPPGYFAPGTISKWAQNGHQLANALHLIPSQNQKVTSSVAQAWHDIMPEGEAKTAYSEDLKTLGPSRAFVKHVAGDDPERAGHIIAWSTVVAAAHADAVTRAAAQADPLDPEKYWDFDRLVTNAVKGNIGKLTQVPADNPTAFLKHLGSDEGSKAAAQWKNILNSDDPTVAADARDKMNAYVADHNEKRKGFITQLLNQPGVENVVGQHLRAYFQNTANWDHFEQATHALHQWTEPEGVFDAPSPLEGVRIKPVYSPSGRLLGQRPKSTDPGQAVRNALADEDPATTQRAYVMPLVQDISGRMGLAQLGTVTAQDGRQLKSLVGSLQQRSRLMGRLANNAGSREQLQGFLDTLGQAPEQVGQGSYSQALQDHFGPTITDSLRTTANTVRQYRAALGEGAPADLKALASTAKAAADRQVQAISDSQSTWEQFHIPAYWDIDKQVKQLDKAIPQLASDVEGVPPEMVSQLRDLGYKPVHGARFVLPTDVQGVAEPFASVSRITQHKISLGNFIHPTLDFQVGGELMRRQHDEVAQALADTGHLDMAAHAKASNEGLGGPVGDVLDRLYSYRRQMMDHAEEGVKLASNRIDQAYRYFQTSIIPQNLRDFSKRNIEAALEGTQYLPDAGPAREYFVNRMQRAIRQSFDLGFKYEGLGAMESWMVAHHPIVSSLKVLSKTRAGDNIAAKAGEAIGYRAVRDALHTKSVLPILTNPALMGAGIGGLAGATQGQPLAGAAAGFSLGAAGGLGSRTLAGALPGAALGAVAGAQGGDVQHGALAGGLAGGLAGAVGGRQAADKLISVLEHSSWYRYTNLAPTYLKLRNLSRFAINPFFDARRYVKSAYLAFLQDLPAGTSLPLARNVSTLTRDYGPNAMHEARGMYNAASNGMYDVMEETERWFSQRGILGFSGKDQMAATMYRLAKQGVDPAKSYETARKIYAYGMGRSPLEKSVNFVFFPFSFEKKLMTQTGKFLSHDMSRLMVLHDAMAGYQLLNSKYNLSGIWQRHLPLLATLQKFNAFDHGLSPGELGGLNAPITNLFLPHMISLDHSNAQALKNTVNGLAPVYTDVDQLVKQAADEGHVVFGHSHLTNAAEVDSAYAQWNSFKQSLDLEAKARGFRHGYADILRHKQLAPIRAYVDAYKAQLMDQSPAWAKALAQESAKAQILQQSLQVDEVNGNGPQFDKLRSFAAESEAAAQELKNKGIDPISNPEDVPPDVYDAMRELALRMAADGDGFGGLYKKYFAKTWGPIERTLS